MATLEVRDLHVSVVTDEEFEPVDSEAQAQVTA